MNFANLLQSKNELTLFSKPRWPSFLPVLKFDGVILARGAQTQADSAGFIEVTGHSLSEVLYDLYPKITLVDLCLLKHQLKNSGLLERPEAAPFDWSSYISLYNMRVGENLEKTLGLIEGFSESVLTWCHEKDLSVNDLAPLRSFLLGESAKNISERQLLLLLLDVMVCLNPTRQEGVRAIEWLVDLQLMNKLNDEQKTILSDSKLKWADWYSHLESLRYPLAKAKTKERSEYVKTLPWPRRSEIRVTRRGDIEGIELKMFLQNSKDLKTQVEGLNHVVSEFHKHDSAGF